jgi:anaerobic magnesium-protoporphyrin IX monomethyl ester cyclase
MNALIIVPPLASKPVQYYNLPMGLLYVASAIRGQCDTTILNLTEHPYWWHERIIKYRAKEADVVFIGGLSVHYRAIKRIVDIVKKYCDIPVIVGGGLVTSQPEIVSKMLNADVFVSGEGDEFDMFGEYSNLVRMVIMKTVPRDKLDILMPAYDLFNMELYLGLQRPSDSIYRAVTDFPRDAAIIASRGCPYNCTFCFHPTGNTYRQRSLYSVFDEIEFLKETYNINILSVYDECFAMKKERLVEFCDRIGKMKLHWSCQLRVDSVDKEIMKMLRDSGCYIISFGIESASNKILANFRKNITVQQINNALDWAKQYDIVVQGNLILGAEEETEETIAESMRWWEAHREYNLSVGMVIPYPGTVMYRNAVAKGLIDPVKFLEEDCPVVNCSNVPKSVYDNVEKKLTMQKAATIYDVRYGENLDFYGRVQLQFKVKCPHCASEQTKTNFALDAVGMGVKYCTNCKGRYFMYGGQ